MLDVTPIHGSTRAIFAGLPAAEKVATIRQADTTDLTVMVPRSVALGDLHGDQKLDMAVATFSSGPRRQ